MECEMGRGKTKWNLLNCKNCLVSRKQVIISRHEKAQVSAHSGRYKQDTTLNEENVMQPHPVRKGTDLTLGQCVDYACPDRRWFGLGRRQACAQNAKSLEQHLHHFCPYLEEQTRAASYSLQNYYHLKKVV
jgi:hypothetical protein